MLCAWAKGKISCRHCSLPYATRANGSDSFNSYTQQICLDDAVVVDPDRAENTITNDGTTMRIMAQAAAKPSAWSRQKEMVSDERAQEALRELKKTVAEKEVTNEAQSRSQQSLLSNRKVDEAEEEVEDVGEQQEQSAETVTTDHTDQDDNDANINAPTDNDQGVISGGDTSPSTSPADEDMSEPEDNAEELSNETQKEVDEEKTPSRPIGKSARARSSTLGSNPTNPVTKPTTKPELKHGSKTKKGLSEAEKEEERQLKQDEKERLAEQRKYRLELEKEAREAERERKQEERAEQKTIREEKRKYEAARREESRKAISDAAKANSQALSLADLEKIKAQNQFVERFSGMEKSQEKYDFDPTAPRGPSQTVVYSSRFIDKLSDVTSDMSISGALTIKASKIGGSGRGSFVDSDKFKQSDLNFYISVKVINQTVNFKDPLLFNRLKTLPVGREEFRKAYGDSFISGFVEGGEFNALVSMKIHNKAKMTDIQAQAKVALTAGPVDITAEANVAIARSNIETNTETTIQVSWCGGGHIKPMEQPWNIESIMQAASRFPDLVAECPQRTYAILTKYESLRSYVSLIPGKVNPLQYENARLYTNALMDTFLSYKSIYTRLTEQISGVQSKLLEIEQWTSQDTDADKQVDILPPRGISKSSLDVTRFEASIKGLDDARKAVRRQMVLIVNEVDEVERNPRLATDENHQEPFQSSTTFETRLPNVQTPQALQRKALPLSGERIMAKPQTEEEMKKELEDEEKRQAAKPLDHEVDGLTAAENASLRAIEELHPGISDKLRVSQSAGISTEVGTFFNNLDFLQADWEVESITVTMREGAVASVEVAYENGLILRKPNKDVRDVRVKTIGKFKPAERIISATIETGNLVGNKDMTRILSIILLTNRGRALRAQAETNEVVGDCKVKKDNVIYENVTRVYLDCPFTQGTFRGFFGRDNGKDEKEGILRIGLIWGHATEKSMKPDPAATLSNTDYEAVAQPVASSGDNAELDQLKAEKRGYDKETSRLNEEIKDLKNDRDKYQQQADKAEKVKAELQGTSTQLILAQAASRVQPSNWATTTVNPEAQLEVSFVPGETSFINPPRVITGIPRIVFPANHLLNASVAASNVTSEKLTLNFRAGGDAVCSELLGSWMAIPDNRKDALRIETGVLNTINLPKSLGENHIQTGQNWRQRMYFNGGAMKDPQVVSWFQGFKAGGGFHSLATEVWYIEKNCFDLLACTWENRNLYDVQVGWLAYDRAVCKGRVQSGRVTLGRSEGYKEGVFLSFPEPFERPPAVFAALSFLDAASDQYLALEIIHHGATTTGFMYNIGFWGTEPLPGGVHFTWIAIA